jgi:pyridoxamine 5'-phosphate oxidase
MIAYDVELNEDPLAVLARWLQAAADAHSITAVSMCVATVDGSGAPSARIVLLRGLDRAGLRFYTSYLSRKGRELAENPAIAAVLHWPELERQVRVEGIARMSSDEESDEYFDSRPRGHRINAWASEQSEPLESTELLQERFEAYETRFEGEEVPRPHSWGGYTIVPARIEFWQSHPNRLHDRIKFDRHSGGWTSERLQP